MGGGTLLTDVGVANIPSNENTYQARFSDERYFYSHGCSPPILLSEDNIKGRRKHFLFGKKCRNK